jgi:DNA-binding transcriptional MerR regulator
MTQTSAATYSVGQVAALAGVTVRTLHHYDEIGLLSPRGRSAAGYRAYDAADLDRLHRILFYRELGFGLDDVSRLLDAPDVDAAAHLRRQHRLLTQRIARLQAMLAALDKEMEARQMGINLTPEERFEVFGDFRPEDYEEEAAQRWCESEAWEQSRRRTRSYTKDDWLTLKAEAGAVNAEFAAAYGAGLPADSPRAMAAAEAHREHIGRWFYDCDHGMQRRLADMYVADERFRAHYEAVAPGLADYVHDAVHANADRASG